MSQEPRSTRQLVFNSALALEKSLKYLSKETFQLDYVPCWICFDRLSVDVTPICAACNKSCARVCARCEPKAYRSCVECQSTICISCDGHRVLDDFADNDQEFQRFVLNGTPNFIFRQCSVRVCWEHHGRGTLSKYLVLCREPCYSMEENTCSKCGFWACPRSRKCEYEVTAMKSINRVLESCEICGAATCGYCLGREEHPCSTCGNCCHKCLKAGHPCEGCGTRLCPTCERENGPFCPICQCKSKK